MRKFLVAIAFTLTMASAFAVDPIRPNPSRIDASTIMFPVGDNGKMLSLHDLAYIKPKEFAKMSGKKMNIFDRAAFSIAQKKLRNNINADGTVSDKKMAKMVAALDGETGFHLGGFALGFLLGLIGVLIAYLINDDYKSNRVKWAWIGFGSFVVIYLILVLALL